MKRIANPIPVSHAILVKIGVNDHDTSLFKETFGTQEITLSTWLSSQTASLYGCFDFIKRTKPEVPFHIRMLLQELTLNCAELAIKKAYDFEYAALCEEYLSNKREAFAEPLFANELAKQRKRILEESNKLNTPNPQLTQKERQFLDRNAMILACVAHAGDFEFSAPDHALRSGCIDKSWIYSRLEQVATQWEAWISSEKLKANSPTAEALALSEAKWAVEVVYRKSKKSEPVTFLCNVGWTDKAMAAQFMLDLKHHYELHSDLFATPEQKAQLASAHPWGVTASPGHKPASHKVLSLGLHDDVRIIIETPWCKRG